MYMDNDMQTPRERISDQMLERILRESTEGTAQHATPRCNGAPHASEPDTDAACHTWGLSGHPLASVYAPLQIFRDLYDREHALRQGTVFRELDLPFHGETVGKGKGGGCR